MSKADKNRNKWTIAHIYKHALPISNVQENSGRFDHDNLEQIPYI